MVNSVFNATAPIKNPSMYGDMLQLMRCSEAASACLRLFGFTDEKLSFSHSFQVIFGVSMLHGGNTSQSRAIFEQKASQYMLSVIEEACDRYNLVRHGNTPKTPLVTAFVQKGARSENTLKEWLTNADLAKEQLRASSSQGKSTGVTATPCTALSAEIGPDQASAFRQAQQSAQAAASSATAITAALSPSAAASGRSLFVSLRLKDFGLSDNELKSNEPMANKNAGMFDLDALRSMFNASNGRNPNAVVCPAYAIAGDRSKALHGRECFFGCKSAVHQQMAVNGLSWPTSARAGGQTTGRTWICSAPPISGGPWAGAWGCLMAC